MGAPIVIAAFAAALWLPPAAHAGHVSCGLGTGYDSGAATVSSGNIRIQ
jgi:hypothetical protein